MGAIAPIRTAMVHFPNEFRAHVPPGKFWDWSSLRCSVVHSGRFKLANAWIPYWTCNAQIFNKPQEGGRGPLGPPVNPPLDSKCYLEQQWKAIFAWDWNKSFTHTYTHTPTPNTVLEQLATEGFGELNTSPYYWIFTSVSVGSIPRYYSVAERGEVPGGPPSPLIFRPNWGPKGPKKNFFEIVPPPHLISGFGWTPPSPLIWRSGSAAATDLLVPATVQMPVQTAPKCGSKPIQYMTLHFRTRRVAASFCYKIHAEIIPFRYGFCAGARANR